MRPLDGGEQCVLTLVCELVVQGDRSVGTVETTLVFSQVFVRSLRDDHRHSALIPCATDTIKWSVRNKKTFILSFLPLLLK